jgi:hypothetical protein
MRRRTRTSSSAVTLPYGLIH